MNLRSGPSGLGVSWLGEPVLLEEKQEAASQRNWSVRVAARG